MLGRRERDWQDIRSKAIGRGAVRRTRLDCGRRGSGIAELDTSSFFCGERRLGAGRGQRTLLLCQSGVKMQHEWVGIGAKLGDDERNPMRRQAANEMHVAGQPTELHDENRKLVLSGSRQRCCQLRPAVERIGAFTRLEFDMLGDEIKSR